MFSVRSVGHSVIRTCVSQKVNVPLNPQFRNGKGDLEYKAALSDRTRRQSQLGHSIMSGGSLAIYLMKALVRSKPFSSISDINSVNVSPTHILPPRSNVTHWFEYFLTRPSCIVLINLARCSKSFEPACMAAKPPFSSMILRTYIFIFMAILSGLQIRYRLPYLRPISGKTHQPHTTAMRRLSVFPTLTL